MYTKKNERIACCQLIATIRLIAGLFEDYETIDEDQSWIAEGGPPPREVERHPKHAVAYVREVTSLIAEAMATAKSLPGSSLIRDTRVSLTLAHEAIGQADVPAEFALLNGDWDKSVECAKDGIRRAYERCGGTLEVLVARLSVFLDDPTPDIKDGANSASASRLFLGAVPKKTDLVDLAVLIDAEKSKPEKERRSRNEIGRVFTNETAPNDQKAKSLLASLRRMKRIGRVNL